MDPTHVVLDCDTANEVDDQFAIANALGVPEGTLDVRGVISVHNTTAHGPGSRDMYQEEAESVVALCASDVTCILPARSARWRAGRSRYLALWPRVPRGRGAQRSADRYHYGTGDGRRIAISGGARVAGERARRLARRVRDEASYKVW